MNPATPSRTRTCAAFVLCLLILFPAARAQAQQSAAQRAAALTDEKVRQIEALVNAEMSRQKIPGLSVAVVAERQVRWTAGFGMQDIENNVAAKAATVYRLGDLAQQVGDIVLK